MSQLVAAVPGQQWFDQACQSFKRTFPQIAAEIPVDRFYVCPICLVAFGEEALALRGLTREHVPPRSLGGKRIVLTCTACNSGAGHEADNHARREADLIGFATGAPTEMKAQLRTKAGRVPIRLSIADRNVSMLGVVKASSKAARDLVQGDCQGAVGEGNWQGFTFNIDFPGFSPDRAAASWLRSAYLVFFAALGYRFVYRQEMNVVRTRIQNPELKVLATFRLIRPENAPEPTLVYIQEPEAFRSYVMFYGHHAVFLPGYNDQHLYERLAEQRPGEITFSGKQYPWPQHGPIFLHDRPLD